MSVTDRRPARLRARRRAYRPARSSVLGLALLAVVAVPASATAAVVGPADLPPDPAPIELPVTCTAQLTVVSRWPGGFVADVEVRAVGEPIDGWRVAMLRSDGTVVHHVWNATLEPRDAAVVAWNESWNGGLPARGTTSFGLLGTGSPDGLGGPWCEAT